LQWGKDKAIGLANHAMTEEYISQQNGRLAEAFLQLYMNSELPPERLEQFQGDVFGQLDERELNHNDLINKMYTCSDCWMSVG
jgi:hypothetical protein